MTAFAFEGFCITMTLSVGFTQRFRGHRDQYRSRFVRRVYAGEDVTEEGGRCRSAGSHDEHRSEDPTQFDKAVRGTAPDGDDDGNDGD